MCAGGVACVLNAALMVAVMGWGCSCPGRPCPSCGLIGMVLSEEWSCGSRKLLLEFCAFCQSGGASGLLLQQTSRGQLPLATAAVQSLGFPFPHPCEGWSRLHEGSFFTSWFLLQRNDAAAVPGGIEGGERQFQSVTCLTVSFLIQVLAASYGC